jgi:hypothetical protein
MKFSTRQLVTLTVFGTLWGAIEISLGSLLHTLNLPMSGALLAAVGLAIALMGRLFVPHRGATLFIGIIATFLKLLSIGSVVVGPMIGIMAEAAIAEVVLSVLGQPNRAAFLLAGALGVLWTLVQPFATGLLLFGREAADIWLGIVERGSEWLGIDPAAAAIIFLILALIHLLVGALGGWLAQDAGRQLQARLASPALSPGK